MWNAFSDDLKLTTAVIKLEKKYVAGMVTTVRTIFAFNLDFLSFSIILYYMKIVYSILYITAGLRLRPLLKLSKLFFTNFKNGALEPLKACNGALEHNNFASGSPEPIEICPGDSEPEIP